MSPYTNPPVSPDAYLRDALRLEAVTACVGFDDLLDLSLARNHPHLDSMIVVTSHEDRLTRLCCEKHGAVCVPSDLFSKNGRRFNKGAAINAGFDYFQYHGWRLHLDSDIVLPENFRRIMFNHTHLDESHIYGCDRMDVVGRDSIHKLATRHHAHGSPFVGTAHGTLAGRYMDPLRGYVPIGFFQLWHARCQKPYPHSLGSAAHDDVMFASLWPRHCRSHLPTVIAHHLCPTPPALGENWEGHRKQGRLHEKY